MMPMQRPNPIMLAALGGAGGQGQPMGMAQNPPGPVQIPGQPGGPMAPGGINPLALLSMGQSQLGRALGNNQYDANALATVINNGLYGSAGGPVHQPQQYGRTPGFNPVSAL